MPINPCLLVGMNNGFVFHFWINLEVVNEYFIGLSMHKAKNFIRFSLNINFLALPSLSSRVKIPALITIGGTSILLHHFELCRVLLFNHGDHKDSRRFSVFLRVLRASVVTSSGPEQSLSVATDTLRWASSPKDFLNLH